MLQSVAEAAEDVWDRYGFDFGTDYSGLFVALSHVNYNVRMAAGEALAAALDENPDSIQVSMLLFNFDFNGSGVLTCRNICRSCLRMLPSVHQKRGDHRDPPEFTAPTVISVHTSAEEDYPLVVLDWWHGYFNLCLYLQETLSTLFSLYIRDAGAGGDILDPWWLGRQGIALALHSSADILRTKDLPVVMTFLISRALVSG